MVIKLILPEFSRADRNAIWGPTLSIDISKQTEEQVLETYLLLLLLFEM